MNVPRTCVETRDRRLNSFQAQVGLHSHLDEVFVVGRRFRCGAVPLCEQLETMEEDNRE